MFFFQVLSMCWHMDSLYAWGILGLYMGMCKGVAAIHGLTVPAGMEDRAQGFAARYCYLRSVSAPARLQACSLPLIGKMNGRSPEKEQLTRICPASVPADAEVCMGHADQHQWASCTSGGPAQVV